MLKSSYVNRPRLTYRPRPRPRSVPYPLPLLSKKRTIQVSSFPYEFETYLIGKSILAFVFFYTSLNWFHYKRTREEIEEFYTSDAKEIKPTKKKEEKNE